MQLRMRIGSVNELTASMTTALARKMIVFNPVEANNTNRQKSYSMTTDERCTMIEHIVTTMGSGCSKEVFQAFRCPVRSFPLMLAVHPVKNNFFVRCNTSSVHLAITCDAVARPSWMERLQVKAGYEGRGDLIDSANALERAVIRMSLLRSPRW